MDIKELLSISVENNASDLHISTGLSPIIRVDGDLRYLDIAELDTKAVSDLFTSIMNDEQQQYFQNNLETDFSYAVPSLARFRVNLFHSNRGLSGAFRTIPSAVLSLEDLKMPDSFKDFAQLPRGLVLVTGPTGSGKTTTLAAIIDYINDTQKQHILTIEDPIEFVHQSNKSLINQREVFKDTHSFNNALRSALREDPDVILVGELRDLETIRLALTAAETGHLVFATLHTNSAAKTIDRIIDVFPGEEKSMIRSMLSESLQAVISQTLLKRIKGGRIAAIEIMKCSHAIRNLIREDKVAQMYSSIQTGQSQDMQTLDQHLKELVSSHEITIETARRVALHKNDFM